MLANVIRNFLERQRRACRLRICEDHSYIIHPFLACRAINALSPRLRSLFHPRKNAALFGDAGRGNARQRLLEIVAPGAPL